MADTLTIAVMRAGLSGKPRVEHVFEDAAVIVAPGPPLVSGPQGLQTRKVIEAVDQAAATGGTVDVA